MGHYDSKKFWRCPAKAGNIKCRDILNICAELGITVGEYMDNRLEYIALYEEKTGRSLLTGKE